jgi:peptidyl-prolyl cis-trans isomerase D
MREGMRPVMWAVAVAFVASLFFVGATTLRKIIRGESSGPVIIDINGRKIGQAEFEQVFGREMRMRYQRYQRESNQPFTEQVEREMRIMAVGAAYNQIVQRELIMAEAGRMGLRVTDDDVRVFIESNPNFQINGKFDAGVYERFLLEQAGVTPGEFESQLRDWILMERVFAMVGDTARVSDAEARALFDREAESTRVAYAFVPAEVDPKAEADEETLKSYYSSHPDQYHAGRRIAISYVLFDIEKQREKLKISDEDVRAYYDRHKNIHFDAGEIRCRHILFQVPPGSPESAWGEAEKKAAAAAARIRGGEDFAVVAKELSEDPGSAEKGGDLGYFGRKQMDPEFEAAAFGLDEGEMSGPVKTIYGYHVIKREADVQPYEEQKDEIRETLESAAAEDLAMSTAMDLSGRLTDGGDLAMEASTLGLKVETPPPFEADGGIGELGWQKRVSEEAFTLGVGDVGSALPAGNFDPRAGYDFQGYIVYQVKAQLEPGAKPFDEAKEKVARDWRRDRALEAVAGAASELYARAAEAGDLEKAAKAADVPYAETLEFTRSRPAPALGGDYGVVAAAFGAEAGDVVGPLRTPSGYFIIKVLEKKPADPTLYATRGEEYRARLLSERRDKVISEWYRDLVARAHIKNNLSAYLGAEAPEPAGGEAPADMPVSPLF